MWTFVWTRTAATSPPVIVPCSPKGLWAEVAEPSLSGTKNQEPLQGLEVAFTRRSVSHSPLPWTTCQGASHPSRVPEAQPG